MILPSAVGEHLNRLMTGVFEPAFILVDHEQVVRQVGGSLDRYGLSGLTCGQPAGRSLWFLQGVLPLDGNEPLVLPSVSFSEGLPAHIHVVPDEAGTWVLLVDASGDEAEQQLFKQAYNQLELDRRRRDRRRTDAEREGTERGVIAMALGSLGGALLERRRGARFRVRGLAPPWLDAVFPVVDGWVDVKKSPFLVDFLEQAEIVWTHGTVDRLESGLWTETTRDGGEEHFDAIAIAPNDRPLLLLRRKTKEHGERQRVLQIAREGRLRFDRLVKETRNNEILVHCIVHDLNGPLTGIMGCLDLLGLQNLSPKADDLLNLARRQTLAQKGMIQGILDAFSAEVESLRRVERDPRLAPDLYAEAQAAVETFRPFAETNSIRLEFDAPPSGGTKWKVAGEAGRLQRILANLIDNALRHSPADTTVRLRLRREGQSVYCDVEDEGAGVPAKIGGTLFNKLTKTEDGGGKAGLGLYFCRITVERWGGEIGFRPRTTGGTSFWFRLDAADEEEMPETRIADILHGMRVLVVEDDDVNRELIREMLTMAGAKVIEAADGEEALTMADPASLDAVLLDLHLPKLNGVEAAARMRTERGVLHQPIIAITGDDRISESEDRSMFDDVLVKPFSSELLRSVLARTVLATSSESPSTATGGFGQREAHPIRLPGLDLERTLDRLGGDSEMLRRILARFESRCRGVTEELRGLIEDEDLSDALRLAHSLKGTAANLGVVGVEGAAARMENGLREQSGDLRALIDELGRSIRELSTSLRLLGIAEEDS